MFWISTYFMLKIMVPVIIIGLYIIWTLYMELWHREYHELKTDVEGLKGLWYEEIERCGGATVTVIVYGPGFPRRKAITKPMLLGTLASPSQILERKYLEGDFEWIV